MQFELIQNELGSYTITNNQINPKMYRYFWTTEPSTNAKNQKHIIDSSEQSIDFQLEEEKRIFIIAEDEQGEKIVFGERTLLIDGMNNFRDLGGYETVHNERVKWGKLYRSDQLYNATEKGQTQLDNLKLDTIIDYRSPDEINKYPNPNKYDEMTLVVDPKAHTAELSAQFTSSKDKEDELLIAEIIKQKESGHLQNQYDIVLQQYENFVNKKESQDSFREMLVLVADPTFECVDQHCRGGKDRTGYGAMLILGTLGVSVEDIIDDYLLTAKNREARNAHKMKGYRTLTDDEAVLEYLYSLIDTKADFIQKSINEIVKKYGSIKEYVKTVLGISGEQIKQMKEMYLEKNE